MQTKSIVQASANVIRIVNLKRGDIYKRYEESSYGSDKVHYGIVNSINNNGDETFIEATEFAVNYSKMEASMKIFSGEKDIAIFPATIEDIEAEFGRCRNGLKEEIQKKKDEIVGLERALETTERLLSGEMQRELSTPEFRELPQQEFNQKKLEAKQSEF